MALDAERIQHLLIQVADLINGRSGLQLKHDDVSTFGTLEFGSRQRKYGLLR